MFIKHCKYTKKIVKTKFFHTFFTIYHYFFLFIYSRRYFSRGTEKTGISLPNCGPCIEGCVVRHPSFFLSGERDSNPRHPAPKAGILTGLNYHPKLNGLTIFGALLCA